MVEFKDVSHTFTTKGGPLKALDSVSADLRRGDFVSLIGASGCGKTTLLRTLAGLQRQTEGSISIDQRPPSLGREDIAYVFQQDALWPWRTIEKAVTFPLEMRGIERRERHRRASEALQMVGLSAFADSYPHQLSGGMRQRINICRALVTNPQLLLMDEPFGALDAQTREYLQIQLAQIVAEIESTVVFVTHDIAEAIYLSNQVIVLSSRPGRVREVIDIPFGDDRDISLKRTPEFQAYVDRIWTLIADDVQSAMAGTNGSRKL